MFDSMKSRLKETLEEKRDFEIEYFSLQKNFIKAKNDSKEKPTSGVDKEQMSKLVAAQKKAEEELQVLRDDNAMLKRQNDSLSDQYRDQARVYDKDQGLDTLTDDYIDSFKRQIENLKQLLEKKD